MSCSPCLGSDTCTGLFPVWTPFYPCSVLSWLSPCTSNGSRTELLGKGRLIVLGFSLGSSVYWLGFTGELFPLSEPWFYLWKMRPIIPLHFLKNIFKRLFIFERGEGGKKERKRTINVRNTHPSVASHTYSNQGLNPQPRYMP